MQDTINGKRLPSDKIITGCKLFVALLLLLYPLTHRDLINSTVKLAVTAFLWCISVGVILIRLRFSERTDRILSVLYSLGMPFYIFVTMEIAVYSRFSMRLSVLFFNLLAIAVLEFLLIALTNSLRWGPAISATLLVLCSEINMMVYEFRTVPILASDLFTIRTAMDVAGNYEFKFIFTTYVPVLLLFLYLMVGCRLHQTAFLAKKSHRVGAIVLSLAFLGIFIQGFVRSDYLENHDVKIMVFRPLYSYRKYGTIATFCRSIQLSILEKPEGYSLETVQKITEEYQSDSVTEEQHPNIIVILNESFSDLQAVAPFDTSEDYMPFIHSLSENCIKTKVYASVLGGQTANTEYEVLTENSMAFLPAQAVPFQLYVQDEMPSLITNLKEEGYAGNVAIHPWKGDNYNRNHAYPDLGFDTYYNSSNRTVKYKHLRKYPADTTVNEILIRDYEETRAKTDAPYDCYAMTMQNHGPYNVEYENFQSDVYLENLEGDYPDVEQYLSLVKQSDQAFRELTEYFSGVEEPTVIVMAGDHQPSLSEDFFREITHGDYSIWKQEQMMARYEIPLTIWANYPLDSTQAPEICSMNYIQTILSDAAGTEKTGYQKFLADMQKEVPAITALGYWGADGRFYSVDDTSSPYYDWIENYRILQYNNLKDTGNRVEEFFELGS